MPDSNTLPDLTAAEVCPDVCSDVCSEKIIHREVVQRVLGQIPDARDIAELAGFYKLFGDPTRLNIISALSVSEMCVCDLCVLLNMKQPAVSHQLRFLKQARIVGNRREGKVVYYTLEDEHIREVLEVGRLHLREHR